MTNTIADLLRLQTETVVATEMSRLLDVQVELQNVLLTVINTEVPRVVSDRKIQARFDSQNSSQL